MSILNNDDLTVNISGSTNHVISTFLRVFLAKERLTEKQLEVATELVTIYAGFRADGVKEPYASTLLFSTDVRKDICGRVSVSAAHLNNTFDALEKKNIIGKEGKKYLMNPNIVPNKSLVFNFKING